MKMLVHAFFALSPIVVDSCELTGSGESEPPTSPPDASVVPGPYALEERVCFMLAERCNVACESERFEALAALDGTLETHELAMLNPCFAPSSCEDFDACVDEWFERLQQ